MEEPLIGIREAARNVGISHSTLSRQVARRQVRSHGGKVRLSEVYEDRANNIDRTIWMHRKKKSTPKIGSGQDAPSLNGAAVHSADDGAYAPDEFTPEMVIEYGRMLDVNDDRRSDPKIVGSVMAL